MAVFAGFSKVKGETILPNEFFDQLLPQMDDFSELKVFLHVLRRLEHQTGWPRVISRTELLHDEQLTVSLAAVGDTRSLPELLDHALERASQRGCLLRLTVRDGEQSEEWFLLNTERGRAVLRELQLPGPNSAAIRHLTQRGFRFDAWINLLMSDRDYGQFDRFIPFSPPLFL